MDTAKPSFPRPLQNLVVFGFFCASIFGAAFSFQKLCGLRDSLQSAELSSQEVLYLPNGRALKALSFGSNNFLADLLWFKTISYFGKHYASDKNYQWLSHMCDLVTDLDSNKRFVYEFCGTMLSWEANAPESAIKIFSKAINSFEDNWRLLYLRGFTYMYFLKDAEAAKNDFVAASKRPNADSIVARLAAKKFIDTNDPQTAIDFLTDILKQTKDPTQSKALEKRLREARYELDFETLEKAVEIFKGKNGRLPLQLQELVTQGIIGELKRDPFGGQYFLDTNGKIASTSKVKRLKFYQEKSAEIKNGNDQR